MIDVIDKKQAYHNVITGKENASKKLKCISSCFWRVLKSILCLVTHILCVIALKLLSDFFWLFLGQGLAFFDEDRLANLPASKTLVLSIY